MRFFTTQIQSLLVLVFAISSISAFFVVYPSDAKAQQITIRNYEVEFLGRTYDATNDETTFTYEARGTGTGRALSHITFSLDLCDYQNDVVAYSPTNNVTLGNDPTTGLEGIKWDIEVQNNQSQIYSVTFSGNILTGDISVAVKAGNGFEAGTLPGPDCTLTEPCANPVVIDFEGLPAGTKVSTQFQSSHGTSIAAINGNPAHPDEALIFDTSDPTGEDPDLGTPNQAFSGPGIGSGPNAGAGNDTALYNSLIIAEDDVDANFDNLVDDPDDEEGGGQLLFSFDGNVELSDLSMIDIEEAGGSITGFDEGGIPLFVLPLPAPGDNTVQDITFAGIDTSGTRLLAVDLVSSGSVGELKVCASPSASPSPSASSSASPSVSPSATPSASVSASPSVSPSSSASVSPSMTPSVSPSMTPSASPSMTPSTSASASPSSSPRASTSPSVSPSPKVSPSSSPSNSPSKSPSPSASATASASPSSSPNSSPSMSPSASPSASPSPRTSPSASPSVSPSVSPSSSPNASPSASPSMSPSASPSVSVSPSPNASPSVSPSSIPSASPSASPPPACEGVVDSCGVCNGPGPDPCNICPGQPGHGELACIACTDIDITQTQTTMDQGVKLQQDIAYQVAKKLLRAFPDSKQIAKYVRNLKDRAFAYQDEAWRLSWSVPSIATQCDNPPEVCVTSSENAAVTTRYTELTRNLNRLIKRAIRRYRKLTGNPTALRKLLKKAKKELKVNLASADSLPPVTTACTF